MNDLPPDSFVEYELKYPLSFSGVQHIRMLLDAMCVADAEHPVGVVSSLYFDTRDRQVLQEKLSGVGLKTTYRLRWYRDLNGGAASDNVFLEVKQRSGPLRRKRRLALPLTGNEVENVAQDSSAMLALSHHFHKLHSVGPAARRVLFPVLRIDYIRYRYVDRLTFGRCNLDFRISAKPIRAWRDAPMDMSGGVFEYKGQTPMPPVPRLLLSRIGLRSGSFSKYALCSRWTEADSRCS